MKKLGFFFFIVFSIIPVSDFSAQNVSPQFSELKGMEDANRNTHLLYRIFSFESNPSYTSLKNDIYNIIPETSIDTILFNDCYFDDSYTRSSERVNTYDFWNQDLSLSIYAGSHINNFESSTFIISRLDSLVYKDLWNFIRTIIISKQNDSLVFGMPNLISYNGGLNWDTLQLAHPLVSVSPFNDSVYFSNDLTISLNSVLFKSTDRGNTFTLVDTGGSNWDFNFYYDFDGKHIYREYTTGYPNRSIKVSVDQGNAFTWQTIYTTNNNLLVTLDQLQSGVIYLADGKKILRSEDYGNTFTLYSELEKQIIGIYKKPKSNKFYAATKYRIFEITNDTIIAIKSLPIPDELLSFYPLKIGNKWVYDYSYVDWNMWGYNDIYFREVLSEKIKPNGKKYFEIFEKFVYQDISDTVYERIDSLEGKVYRFQADCLNSEQLIEDLVMEVNDLSPASRFDYCLEHPPTELLSELNFDQWGISGKDRKYNSVSLLTSDYNLFSEIGLAYFRLSDDNFFKTSILKGMIKNGIVYGDTTLTDVIVCTNQIPTSYNLNQNYPNPFNPITTIKYAIPNVTLSGAEGSQVILKVYDILGKEIVTLVNEEQRAGNYEVEFNLARDSRSAIASGIYFYRLQSGSFVETKKMVLIK